MAQIAVGDQGQAAGAIQNRPYPPSWVDRFTDWVQRLPGPAWLFYVGVAVVLIVIRTVVAWSDGSYPAGTFFPVHVLVASTAPYMAFTVGYINNRAEAALADFRPVLTVDDARSPGAGVQPSGLCVRVFRQYTWLASA